MENLWLNESGTVETRFRQYVVHEKRLLMKKFIIVASWILVIACMITIFTLSAQLADDSKNLSEGVTMHIFKGVSKIMPSIDISFKEFNYIVRKFAHFTIYFILGVLVLNAFRRGGRRSIRFICISFIVCVLYAMSDEFHQSFVPGRGPAIFDVLIDSSGSATGIMFYIMTRKVKNIIVRRIV